MANSLLGVAFCRVFVVQCGTFVSLPRSSNAMGKVRSLPRSRGRYSVQVVTVEGRSGSKFTNYQGGSVPKQLNRVDPAKALELLKWGFSNTDDGYVLCMIWAAHAIQDGREGHAKRFLNFPKEAVTTSLDSKYRAFPWDLETLITVDFNTLKLRTAVAPLKTNEFNTVADVVNLLRSAEDNETPGRVDETNVLMELHRISHRQFGWQRNFANTQDIYRYIYIYGQGDCAAFFEAKYGVSIVEFFAVAFAYYAYLSRGPWCSPLKELDAFSVSSDALSKSLSLLSCDVWQARRKSKELLSKFAENAESELPTIYQPSYLRIKPIVRRDLGLRQEYIAPLPTLIVLRATLGLYYDLQGGGTSITNDATMRFEQYARRTITAHCPGFEAMPAFQYVHKGNRVDTPDALVRRDGSVVAVFECKATKLTFEAQYAEDPVEAAKSGYSQIAKAIFQLWRFFSHVRRGIIDCDVAPDAPAIVLTMDAWTQMSRGLRDTLVAEAIKIAEEKEPDLIEEDRRHPIFCPIQELDRILVTSNEDQVLATFRAGKELHYQGWSIQQVRDDAVPALTEEKRYAFDPSELLPWWRKLPDGRG